MSLVFAHETLGQRVLFGTGRAGENLSAEVSRLGAKRVMVIASEAEATVAAKVAASISVALTYDDVAPHVPVEKAEKARAAAAEADADLLVCIGGGSTTGLAKAIAMTTGIPIVAVPTTYAGSEATNVWGLTEAARKTTGTDGRVLPATVVYDAELTLSLPAELSVASGLNALAHCVDSMWAPRADPINQALAAEGIRALAAGLPAVKADPAGIEGREQCLYGAYLAAVAFASAGSGMHHKICHVLGGAWNMPHAQTHATVLPYVLAFNAPAAPAAAERIAAALGNGDAVEGLNHLREALDAPTALKNHGLAEENIGEAAQLILPFIPASNPRPVTKDTLQALLRAAWAGTTPGL
jgi:maleylacetate reductase